MTEEEAQLIFQAADAAHKLNRHKLLRAMDAFNAACIPATRQSMLLNGAPTASSALEFANAFLEAARAYRQTGIAWHDAVFEWSNAKVETSKKES